MSFGSLLLQKGYRRLGVQTERNIAFGCFTPDECNSAISSIIYTPLLDMNGIDVVQVRMNDDGVEEFTDFVIQISPVNDAPQVTFPTGTMQLEEDSQIQVMGIVVEDVDFVTNYVAAAVMHITVSVNLGSLSLQGDEILWISQNGGLIGDFAPSHSFSGQPEGINKALHYLQYSPPPNYNGFVELSVTVEDMGHYDGTLDPQILTTTGTMILSVLAVPDPVFISSRCDNVSVPAHSALLLDFLTLSSEDSPIMSYIMSISCTYCSLHLTNVGSESQPLTISRVSSSSLSGVGNLEHLMILLKYIEYSCDLSRGITDLLVLSFTDEAGSEVSAMDTSDQALLGIPVHVTPFIPSPSFGVSGIPISSALPVSVASAVSFTHDPVLIGSRCTLAITSTAPILLTVETSYFDPHHVRISDSNATAVSLELSCDQIDPLFTNLYVSIDMTEASEVPHQSKLTMTLQWPLPSGKTSEPIITFVPLFISKVYMIYEPVDSSRVLTKSVEEDSGVPVFVLTDLQDYNNSRVWSLPRMECNVSVGLGTLEYMVNTPSNAPQVYIVARTEQSIRIRGSPKLALEYLSQLVYRPVKESNDQDSLTLSLQDPTNGRFSVMIDVVVSVSEVPDPPTITLPSSERGVKEFVVIEDIISAPFQATVADVDSELLTLQITVAEGEIGFNGVWDKKISIDGTPADIASTVGILEYSPPPNVNYQNFGPVYVHFEVHDGVTSAMEEGFIVIESSPDPPVITLPPSLSLTEGQSISLSTLKVSCLDSTNVKVKLTSLYGELESPYSQVCMGQNSMEENLSTVCINGPLQRVNFGLSVTRYTPKVGSVGEDLLSIAIRNELFTEWIVQSFSINVSAIDSSAARIRWSGYRHLVPEDSGILDMIGLSVAGASPTSYFTVAISTEFGLLAAHYANGTAISFDSMQQSLWVTGTSVDINAALDSLTVKPPENAHGLVEVRASLFAIGQIQPLDYVQAFGYISPTNDAPSLSFVSTTDSCNSESGCHFSLNISDVDASDIPCLNGDNVFIVSISIGVDSISGYFHIPDRAGARLLYSNSTDVSFMVSALKVNHRPLPVIYYPSESVLGSVVLVAAASDEGSCGNLYESSAESVTIMMEVVAAPVRPKLYTDDASVFCTVNKTCALSPSISVSAVPFESTLTISVEYITESTTMESDNPVVLTHVGTASELSAFLTSSVFEIGEIEGGNEKVLVNVSSDSSFDTLLLDVIVLEDFSEVSMNPFAALSSANMLINSIISYDIFAQSHTPLFSSDYLATYAAVGDEVSSLSISCACCWKLRLGLQESMSVGVMPREDNYLTSRTVVLEGTLVQIQRASKFVQYKANLTCGSSDTLTLNLTNASGGTFLETIAVEYVGSSRGGYYIDFESDENNSTYQMEQQSLLKLPRLSLTVPMLSSEQEQLQLSASSADDTGSLAIFSEAHTEFIPNVTYVISLHDSFSSNGEEIVPPKPYIHKADISVPWKFEKQVNC